MKFSQSILVPLALALGAAAQASLSPADQKCQAAAVACPTPDGTCVANMCAACPTQLPCCAQPSASQLGCFSSQAAAIASLSTMPPITNTAQLTSTTACVVAGEIGAACAAATTNFAAVPDATKASCLCYQNIATSSAVWAPDFFDAAVSGCAAFLQKAGSTSEAAMQSSAIGLCAKAGNIRSLSALPGSQTEAPKAGAPQAGSAAGSAAASATPTGTDSGSSPSSTGSSSEPATSDGAKKSLAAPATGDLSKTFITLGVSVLAILGLALQL